MQKARGGAGAPAGAAPEKRLPGVGKSQRRPAKSRSSATRRSVSARRQESQRGGARVRGRRTTRTKAKKVAEARSDPVTGFGMTMARGAARSAHALARAIVVVITATTGSEAGATSPLGTAAVAVTVNRTASVAAREIVVITAGTVVETVMAAIVGSKAVPGTGRGQGGVVGQRTVRGRGRTSRGLTRGPQSLGIRVSSRIRSAKKNQRSRGRRTPSSRRGARKPNLVRSRLQSLAWRRASSRQEGGTKRSPASPERTSPSMESHRSHNARMKRSRNLHSQGSLGRRRLFPSLSVRTCLALAPGDRQSTSRCES
mmetsp:Transcript_85996/g.199952  ORF Transcript_85996/g.199952 Transcript_85996/m.199952 type:complete len:314 (+) Transcript_85996:582-1523(+)